MFAVARAPGGPRGVALTGPDATLVYPKPTPRSTDRRELAGIGSQFAPHRRRAAAATALWSY